MREELEQQLLARHPKILNNWGKPPTESSLARGIECHDGWFDLIDQLCAALQSQSDRENEPQVVAAQIKQKLGALRFYADDELTASSCALIQFAQSLSTRVCETCGSPGQQLQGKRGWISTACPAHAPAGSSPVPNHP